MGGQTEAGACVLQTEGENMIKTNLKTLDFSNVPTLPVLTREDVGPEYPADAPLPVAHYRVVLACGNYGGSYGYAPTLEGALENALREGWTPVRAYVVEVGWDRIWGDTNTPCWHTQLFVERKMGKGKYQTLVDEVVLHATPEFIRRALFGHK